MPYSFWIFVPEEGLLLEQKGWILFQDGGILISDMTDTLSPSSL